MGLNGTDVGRDRVADVEDRAPDGRIVHGDDAIRQGELEHGVDDQVQPHPGAVTADRALAQGDHREVLALLLERTEFTLELRDAVRVVRDGRSGFVEEFVNGIAVHGTGTPIDVTFHAGPFGDVGQIRGGGGVVDEVLGWGEFSHRIVGKTSQKNHLIISLEVFFGYLEDILLDDLHPFRQVIAKPEKVENVDFVAPVQEPRGEHGADISGPARNEYFHAPLLMKKENCRNLWSSASRPGSGP